MVNLTLTGVQSSFFKTTLGENESVISEKDTQGGNGGVKVNFLLLLNVQAFTHSQTHTHTNMPREHLVAPGEMWEGGVGVRGSSQGHMAKKQTFT